MSAALALVASFALVIWGWQSIADGKGDVWDRGMIVVGIYGMAVALSHHLNRVVMVVVR